MTISDEEFDAALVRVCDESSYGESYWEYMVDTKTTNDEEIMGLKREAFVNGDKIYDVLRRDYIYYVNNYIEQTEVE